MAARSARLPLTSLWQRQKQGLGPGPTHRRSPVGYLGPASPGATTRHRHRCAADLSQGLRRCDCVGGVALREPHAMSQGCTVTRALDTPTGCQTAPHCSRASRQAGTTAEQHSVRSATAYRAHSAPIGRPAGPSGGTGSWDDSRGSDARWRAQPRDTGSEGQACACLSCSLQWAGLCTDAMAFDPSSDQSFHGRADVPGPAA